MDAAAILAEIRAIRAEFQSLREAVAPCRLNSQQRELLEALADVFGPGALPG